MVSNCVEYEKRLEKTFQGEACVKHLPVLLTLRRGSEEIKIVLTSKIFGEKNKTGQIIGKNWETKELVNVEALLKVPEGEDPWEISAELNDESISLLNKIAKLTDFEEFCTQKSEAYRKAANDFLAQLVDLETLTEEEKQKSIKYVSSIITNEDGPFLTKMCFPQPTCDEYNDLVPCYMAAEYCTVKDCPYKVFLKT